MWERIIHGAWKTGEPGVFFIDKANYYNPVPHLGELRGDQSLRRAAAPAVRRLQPRLDQPRRVRASRRARSTGTRLRRVIHLSTHFLENVIDANQYPLAEITDLAQHIRRIGLGVMGLADLFVRLGIPYDSDEGVALGRKLQQFVDEEAKVESERLAEDPGRLPRVGAEHLGPGRDRARAGPTASASARCGGSGTATSPPSRRPAPSRSSPAAARASSRSSRWRSCGTRPAC